MFGKPYVESKFYRYIYWFGVGFYFFAVILSIIQSIFYGGWALILFPAIVFPIMFRIVYKINTHIHKSFKGMNKRVILIIGILLGLFMVGMFASVFFFGDNIAINASKTTINGEVNLSIGSLKGYHEVETFEINEIPKGTITIPYEASVEEGEYIIYVEHSGETIWEDKISSSKSGVIKFEGEKGTYDISVYTEEAKKIKLNILLY